MTQGVSPKAHLWTFWGHIRNDKGEIIGQVGYCERCKKYDYHIFANKGSDRIGKKEMEKRVALGYAKWGE